MKVLQKKMFKVVGAVGLSSQKARCCLASLGSNLNWRSVLTLYGVEVKKWSGQQDSNLRPSAPKADALPGCAMPRQLNDLDTV